MNAGEAADKSGTVARFEFAEPAAIYNTRNDLTHVLGLFEGARQDTVQFVRVI